MDKLLYLGLGSVAGGFARHFISTSLGRNLGIHFPFGTLAVNLLGCFAIGVLSAFGDDRFFLGENGKILLITGFCGAFTTFSAFMHETGNLLKYGEFFRAALYVLASVLAGFLVFRLGVLLGELI